MRFFFFTMKLIYERNYFLYNNKIYYIYYHLCEILNDSYSINDFKKIIFIKFFFT